MLNFRPAFKNSLVQSFLYRSGELINISENDIDFIINDLSISCYIDLRTNDEITKNGKPLQLIEAGIEWKSFPIEDDNHYFRNKSEPDYYDYYDSYRCLLEINKNQFKNIFLYIATAYKRHCVFGCFAGKDRTGILTILLMMLLGFNEKEIISDYVLSGEYLLKNIDYFKEKWLSKGLTRNQYIPRLTPSPKTALLLIEYINNQYGTIQGYLSDIGLHESSYKNMLMDLRSNLNLISDAPIL